MRKAPVHLRRCAVGKPHIHRETVVPKGGGSRVGRQMPLNSTAVHMKQEEMAAAPRGNPGNQ